MQVSALSLQLIAHRLHIMRASVVIAATALHHQSADIDFEVDAVLRHQVAEPLSHEIDHLQTLAAGGKAG